MNGVVRRWGALASLTICASAALLAIGAPTTPAAPAAGAACTSSVGPGIPPPPGVPSGIPGFHAHWYGQSGYPTLCPGERSTAVVAYYNSGSLGWVSNRMGEMAFLGTWEPSPGQDMPSQLGGDGTAGSPNTGWPRYNRVAAQPAEYVGPGQVSWFQFTIQAPQAPGTYKLYIRPLVEGAQWMEDFGVFWQVTVTAADSTEQISVAPTSEASVEIGTTRAYTATASGAGGCVDLAFIEAPGLNFEGRLSATDANGRVTLSTAARFVTAFGTAAGGSYVDCVTLPSSQTVPFTATSDTANAYVRPIVFRDLNANNALDSFSEPYGLGGVVRFIPPEADSGSRTVTVGVASIAEDYFTDGGAATYRYDTNDVFRRAGVGIGFVQFEQLISAGDVLSVTYAPESGGVSTFDITTDRGREAPTVVAIVDSWDLGPTQNDVGLRITEPPTNVQVEYSVQRARTGPGAGCDASSGAYGEIVRLVMDVNSNTELYRDRDLAVGAYCYRVGATDPVSGTTAFGYSNRVTIENPPPPVVKPRSVDARITTSAGSAANLDAGDVIKIAFDKDMQSPVSHQMRVQDADGTIADIRCLLSEQDCTLNASSETLGGVVYPPGRVITITMRTPSRTVVAGSASGIQLNATAVGGDFPDVAGNTWDVAGSTDVTLGAPD